MKYFFGVAAIVMLVIAVREWWVGDRWSAIGSLVACGLLAGYGLVQWSWERRYWR